MQPRVLNELADVIARPLSIVFKRSWQLGEIPESWKRASVTLIFRKGRKEGPGNYRSVSLSSVPRKVMELLILETISRHMKDKKVSLEASHWWGITVVNTGSISFNICINELDPGRERTLSKFTDDTKVGGTANTPWLCCHLEGP